MQQELISNLASKFSILFVFSFIIFRIPAIKNAIQKKPVNLREKLIMAFAFGIFGMFGSYFSVDFQGALINTRIIGVAMGGIIGGPFVGLVAGIIAGIHRASISSLGTYTTFACAIAVPFEGLIAGYMWVHLKNRKNKYLYIMLIGAVCESFRKISLLIFCKPFDTALDLVLDIWIPTVLISSIGLVLLYTIIDSIFKEQIKESAYQVNTSLHIVNRILPYLREGLDSDKIDTVAEILYDLTSFDGVVITNRNNIIAYKDTSKDKRENIILSNYTHEVLKNGKFIVKNSFEDFDSDSIEKNTNFSSFIVVPIKDDDKIIGSIRFYKMLPYSITEIDIETAKGLSDLFSTEVKMDRLEQNVKLLAHAEIAALQAQINPHFLFNSLMVISSLCRTNSEKAREMINHLANHFRKNLTIDKQLVSLDVELDHVKSYVAIEQTRFEEKLKVNYEIDDCDCYLPPLTLQPIVENAIKHGLLPIKEGGNVSIEVKDNGDFITIKIQDDGIGIKESKIKEILDPNFKHSDSIGLNNVIGRLNGLFGESCSFKINSAISKGTNVEIKLDKDKMSGLEVK